MRTVSSCALVLALLLSSGGGSNTWFVQAGTGGAPAASQTTRLENWPDGPMRYLLSRQELQDFRKLPDDQARGLFIVRFWQRWDPTPLTLENESRREYWWRVIEANRRYRDSVRDGWLTDRGRIFILLGEPDTEQKDELGGIGSMPGRGAKSAPSSTKDIASTLSTPSGVETGMDNDTPERGVLRWIYRRLPGNRSEPETVFAFSRDESGEWRLSRNPRNYGLLFRDFTSPGAGTVEGKTLSTPATTDKPSPTLDAIPPHMPPEMVEELKRLRMMMDPDPHVETRIVSALERIQETLMLSEIGRTSLLPLDMADALRVPGPGEMTADILTSTEFLNRLPVTTGFAFFRAPGGRTLVRAGASVAPKALYNDAVMAPDVSSFLVFYARFGVVSGPAEVARPAAAPEAPGQPMEPPAAPAYYANTENEPRLVTAAEAASETPLEAWTELTLPPGRYEAGLGIEDAATGQISSLRKTVDVPAFAGDHLALSSILPVHGVEQAESGLRPQPRVGAAFLRAEDFGIYFEVYGLTAGEPFTVTSRFFQRDGDEVRPIGNPIVRDSLTDPAQAWMFSLTRWPSGTFRLEVTLVQGTAQTSGTLDFSVR